jgi:hypothetical protein
LNEMLQYSEPLEKDELILCSDNINSHLQDLDTVAFRSIREATVTVTWPHNFFIRENGTVIRDMSIFFRDFREILSKITCFGSHFGRYFEGP